LGLILKGKKSKILKVKSVCFSHNSQNTTVNYKFYWSPCIEEA